MLNVLLMRKKSMLYLWQRRTFICVANVPLRTQAPLAPAPVQLYILYNNLYRIYKGNIMLSLNFQRLLHTPLGKIIISILLGLGLSALFYQTCQGKNCIAFHGPVISDFDDKIYKHGDECFKYNVVSAPCDKRKNIIDIH